ncbi:RNA methyltransferase [Georgenia halophila]|uniref:RNA methyltransferase n=1 Tax=Georgenia halophila TaxID=620889 RepID=A0ABP8L8V6_9MICO
MLTNTRAERVRRVGRLSGRSSRLRHRQFLVEGPQGVREAVRHASPQVRDIYLTDDAAVRHPEIVEAARGSGLHVHEASPEVLDAMSQDAQGVLAVLELPMTEPSPADLRALRGGAGPRLVAVLARVTDPGNAGTVIRAADAAGADAIVLADGSVEVTNPKVVRATAGSLFHLPVITGVDLADAIDTLRGCGSAVLAADGAGEWDLDDLLDRAVLAGLPGLDGAPDDLSATSLVAPDLTAPVAWVFGNEAHGLSGDQLALCDAGVRVPIHGHAESLNLATAAAVCLYASARAQRA